MSLALQSFFDTKKGIEIMENEIYNKIIDNIKIQVKLGFFQMEIKFHTLLDTDDGQYNFTSKNRDKILQRLKEDGFYVAHSGPIHIYWDNPVGKDYIVGGAKYNEAKKALEQ